MKILHITNCLLGGGIQNFLLSLLPAQVKLGHSVYLIVIERDQYEYSLKLEQTLKNNGVQVLKLNKIKANKISLIKTLWACRKLVSGINPDVVNSHGEMSHVYGALSVINKNIAHCVTIHNGPEIWPKAIRILNNSKPLIYCSDSAFELRVQSNKMYKVINNGISPDITCSKEIADLRKELKLPVDTKIVVLVGSMRPQKNYEFLKDVANLIEDEKIHFCICGGNYGPGYINGDIFNGIRNIHLMGLRSDVSSIENGSNLFLSCATFEGLPIAVLEAFFNGIPCVLSPIIQHKKIADGIDACFIPNDFTASSFAATINKALSDNRSHSDIYNKRKNTIEKFTINNVAEKYVAFYKECINQR